jgi:hypothetical protein
MQSRTGYLWKVILVTILAAFSATGCGPQTVPVPEPSSSPTGIPQPILIAPTDTPAAPDPNPLSEQASPTAPSMAAPRNTHYSLNAVLNYGQHSVEVEERIRYSNKTPDPITNLLLVVEPVYYPGVFELLSLVWEDGQTIENYSWDGSFLTLPLLDPLAPAQELVLLLTYRLQLPSPATSAETRPVPFGFTARQTNLVDWYPYIPPYQPGQGWLAHRAGFFGEHQVYESSDFTVTIRIADQRSDLVVAASAPDEGAAGIHQYHLDNARNFVWSVSSDYQVKTAMVGDTTIVSYSFAFHELAGEATLQTTAEALELYNRLFGDYPRKQLSVVEADFLDGMEYEGLYFLSNGFYNLYQGTPGEYLIAIAAHETAHQWWYALVGNDQALEPWLDEAFCTYSEKIYYENLHPEALDWWWAYRIHYYDPHGWVNGSIYNPDGYRAYRDAVYLNGAIFLDALRNSIGDEPFLATLQDYVQQYAYQIATADDFFNLVEKHSQVDLMPLKEKYFSPP